MGKYIDGSGLSHFMSIIKGALNSKSDTGHDHDSVYLKDVNYNSSTKKITKTKGSTTSDVVTLSTVATSGSYNDLSNKPTIPAGIEKTTTTPKMDGTASVGSETKFAAGDHVHPTDTTRVPTSRTVNGKALSSDITLYATDIPMSSTVNTTVYDTLEGVEESVGELLSTMYVDGVGPYSDGGSTEAYHFSDCDTAAATAAKTASVAGFKLYQGSLVYVRFTVTNTAAVANLTLNVSSTGAKAIKYRGANLPSVGTLAANRVYAFIYDGTN